jgi:hypothetical protein
MSSMTTTRTSAAQHPLLRGRRAVVALLVGAGVALTPSPAQAHPSSAHVHPTDSATEAAPGPSGRPTPTSSPYSLWDPHVRPVVKEVTERFNVSTVYTRPDHSPTQGRAADFMVYNDREKGDALTRYVIDNAARFRVEYVIWRQRIYTVRSGSWRAMEDRGSPTANHMDHPHVAFLPAR